MKGLIIFGLLSVYLVGVCCDKEVKACCNELTGNLEKPDDEKVGCFIACVLKEEGIMKNGIIDVHKLFHRPVPELKECANLRGKDDCDTAKKFVACVMKVFFEETCENL